MLFVVDIGNTNMEFGIFCEGKLKTSFRLVTNHNVTSDELGLNIRQFFLIHNIEVDAIEEVIVASVVPQVIYSVKNAMRKYLNKEALVVHENLKINIVNKYDNPKEVGADRLVNAYAGYKKYKGPLIVIDFGTATTFDVINEQGEYLGGVIYPGLKISLDALVQKASKLPKIEIDKPSVIVGKNTISSIQSGIVVGYTGAVENIVKQIEKEIGSECTIIATGGLAGLIAQQTEVIEIVDKSLILDGLYMIYEDYKAKLLAD